MFKPPSLFASQVAPTATAMPWGGRGFYVRAERASLPPHAPDMLAVRTQAIDGARTCTLLDSHHCRLLPFLHHSGLEPFLDQSQNAGVGDAMLHELDQPTVIEVVEKTANVGV